MIEPFIPTTARRIWVRDLPYVEQLMNGMGVGLAFLEEGYQAVL